MTTTKRPTRNVRWYLGTQSNPDDREQIEVSAEDAAKHPRNGDLTPFEVTDLLTGKSVRLRRADCGLGCQCALERVTSTSKRPTRNVSAADLGLPLQDNTVTNWIAETMAQRAFHGPWVVGTMGHDTDMETQVNELKRNANTDDEWQPIGYNDEDGFAGVIALAHPANAKLIAAAPDLLAACRAALLELREPEQSQVRAAIAKAEGRTR